MYINITQGKNGCKIGQVCETCEQRFQAQNIQNGGEVNERDDIFKVILKLTKSMQGFCEPFCYQGSNEKADVILFTSIRLVNELLCLLSGVSEINLATYFKRTLGGRRKGHKTSVIVSDVKDFAFIYKVKQGRLIIAFHYGKWNIHGFSQHS